MNCLADKTLRNLHITASRRFIIFLIFAQLLNYSLNSQTWQVYTTANSGLPNNLIGAIAFDTNNIKWIGTDNGLAKFDGTNWTVYDTSNSPLPVPNIGSLAIERNNVLWIGTGGGGIARFDGASWTTYDTNNSPILSNIITSVIIDNNNVKWFCTFGGFKGGLARFDDNNWTIYTTTNSGLPSNQTWCLALEDTVKWIGTFGNGLVKYDNMNWTVYTFMNSGLPSNAIRGISIDNLGNKWIATFFGGIAKFNSNLNQWVIYNSTNSGLPNNNNFDVETQNHIKWIGGGGLARFNDTSWTVFNTSNSPLPSNEVIELALDRTGKLWIGTDLGLAVYNTGIDGINNQNENVPKSFILRQNYPNPFNPWTIIEYELLKTSSVSLEIYDITGKLIKIIENDINKPPGLYKVNFNASDLPSSVYYYRLQTENFSETKKMVLIK